VRNRRDIAGTGRQAPVALALSLSCALSENTGHTPRRRNASRDSACRWNFRLLGIKTFLQLHTHAD
jgi:hypothetical protein